MGTFSIWHLLILMVFALLLFGRGKISEIMSDTAKGIKAFKKGMSDDDDGTKKPDEAVKDAKTIEHGTQQASATADKTKVG